jgi:hypothetical protein
MGGVVWWCVGTIVGALDACGVRTVERGVACMAVLVR